MGGVAAARVGAVVLLDPLPQQLGQLGVLRLGADRVRRRHQLEDPAQGCVVLAQAPAEPDPDPVAGADPVQAGVHRPDELVGLVDPAAELFGYPAEDEAGEHVALPLAQRRPAGLDPGCKRAGRPGQGVLVARTRHLDQEHVVVS